MEEKKFLVHCFGTKSCADLFLKTEIKIAQLIDEPYYTIDQPPISSYVEFVNKTLRQGKEGDIQYAIQGIVGELAELMKELDPTIPPDNIETIVGTRNHTIFVHFKYSLYINDTRRIQVD
jgi:hypothetical protein